MTRFDHSGNIGNVTIFSAQAPSRSPFSLFDQFGGALPGDEQGHGAGCGGEGDGNLVGVGEQIDGLDPVIRCGGDRVTGTHGVDDPLPSLSLLTLSLIEFRHGVSLRVAHDQIISASIRS
jgi:hypothetical protein